MIHPTNTERFKQEFRFADCPAKKVRGFFQKPPIGIRFTIAQPRSLEVAYETFDLRGKQIISVGSTRARYLVGSFVKNFNSFIYMAYEANAQLPLSRDTVRIDPVTKMEAKVDSGTPEMIWVNLTFNSQNIVQDMNPNQIAYVISTVELKPKDKLGNMFIRDVHMENDLYKARADYGSVKQ